QIKARLARGYPIEIQDAFSHFTPDSATEFLFGKDVGSLGAGLPYPKNTLLKNDESFFNHPSNLFVQAFMQGQKQSILRSRLGDMWPLAEFWKDKVKVHRDKIDEFTKPTLEEKLNELLSKETGTEKDGTETLLDHLIRSTHDKQVIEDELVNILAAGRDTTASLLTFAIYVLTQRPDLTEKLRKEILNFVGHNDRPAYKNITDMKYLRAFLNETLRLYPPVPFNTRPIVPTATPHSLRFWWLVAFERRIYPLFLIHRREDLWEPLLIHLTALEFDPDRFIDERARKYLTPNPFIFTPFNAGPKICIGQQESFLYSSDAYMEGSISYFLIKFLQSFADFKMDLDAQPEWSIPPKEWVPSPGTTKGRDKVMLECLNDDGQGLFDWLGVVLLILRSYLYRRTDFGLG
ncbi:hypothetical protein GYMLUDRAFT_1026944, partial [Collybiopsis luxurians FD-317 M1]